MIQIVPGDRTSADDLAEVVDTCCNTVVAARPDAQVDRHTIAPEYRMRVYAGRVGVARNVAGIIHRRCLGTEESGRYGQLVDSGGAVRISDIILPNDREKVALANNKTRIIDREGFAG